MMGQAILTGLFIYPVKGCRGIALNSVAVEPRGLANDRRYVIVDANDAFISQRSHPVLATIDVALDDDGLHLSRADGDALTVPPLAGAARRPVRVWKDDVDALDCGDAAAAWLSETVGEPCRLAQMDARAVRPVAPAFARPDDEVSFADGFPLLLTNTASLQALNAELSDPVPMARFRPNIVVEGFGPWEEDDAASFKIGGLAFRAPKTCARCLVITTDQRTGERLGPEPLATLARIHAQNQKALFGVNLIPDQVGALTVGDKVQLIEGAS